MTEEQTPEVDVQSFTFRPDGYLEITFVERRDQGVKAGLIKTLVVEPTVLDEEELADVLDSMRDFVDAGLRHIRTGEGG